MLAACLAILACGGAAVGGARPPELEVPLCCASGQRLRLGDALVLSVAEAREACEPAPVDAAFEPLVYAPARGNFLRRGQLPAHWRLRAPAPPACERLRVLREHAAPYALLANNGSLLERGAARALPPARYCADTAAALVCADEPGASAAPPSKCCAAGSAFDGAHCVQQEERGRAALEELRAFANGSGVTFGWPACAGGSRYAVAGALEAARALADGALALGAEVLARGAWCAEALAAPAPGERGARVLACEAAARAAGEGERGARHVLYGAGLAVGAAFLAATLAAGFALPAAHHALHWRCQTHYVAALMLGDALLAGTQLAGDRVPPTLCRVLGELARPRGAGAILGPWSDVRFVCSMWGCSGVHALPVPVCVLLAEHDVLQHMVDVQGLPADEPGARAGGVAAARVHGVRVGRAAAGGGRGRAAGRAAGAGGGRRPAASAVRGAALLVLRRHGDPRLLLRAGGRAAARQPGALREHHAPAHLRPLAPRRGQVYFRAGGTGARVRQAGGGDGRDVGRGRGVVGGGRARLHVVRDGPAERAAGRVHLPGGGVPAARVGRAQALRRGVLGARRGARRGGGARRQHARHALLHAPALLRRVAHQHDAGAARPRPRARTRRRARAPPHGDRVLSSAAPALK